jgi:intracellular multiplication protein IcmV
MKLGFLRPSKIVKGTVKTVANVPAWLGYQLIKENTQGMVEFIKPVLTPVEAKRKETFEEALIRLNITEADLVARQRRLQVSSWIFIFFSICLFAYAMYMLWHGYVFVMLISLALTGLAVIKACFYRFWIFQIRNRRLGCTFGEWWRNRVED